LCCVAYFFLEKYHYGYRHAVQEVELRMLTFGAHGLIFVLYNYRCWHPVQTIALRVQTIALWMSTFVMVQSQCHICNGTIWVHENSRKYEPYVGIRNAIVWTRCRHP